MRKVVQLTITIQDETVTIAHEENGKLVQSMQLVSRYAEDAIKKMVVDVLRNQ